MGADRRGWGVRGLVVLSLLVACEGTIQSNETDVIPVRPGPTRSPRTTEAIPLAPRMRLLNDAEYRASVQHLLGLDTDEALRFDARSNGYPTSERAQVDGALFDLLFAEAERLAESWIGTGAADEFPCIAAPDAACLTSLAETLVERGYRRPARAGEAAELVALYDEVYAESEDATLALQAVVTRALMSVHFLHRMELGEASGGVRMLDSYEQASLLSFAAHGGPPDAALLEAAARGLDADARRSHARRLLESEAGQRVFARFLRFYLRVDVLEDMAESPSSYPKLSSDGQLEGLGEALLEEFDAFVQAAVFSEEGDLNELLRFSRVPVSPETAALYGESEGEDGWVDFAENERRGVLTLASVMTAHSSASLPWRDSPVSRGLMFKNQLFCESVGLPAGIDVAAAAEMAGLDLETIEQLPVREQAEAVMNQATACTECHAGFMPSGFLFGNFDALGRFQREYLDQPIRTDVDSVVWGGESRGYEDHLAFIEDLQDNAVVQHCFTYALSAFVSGSSHQPAVATMVERRISDGTTTASLLDLMVEILADDELYLRRERDEEVGP